MRRSRRGLVVAAVLVLHLLLVLLVGWPLEPAVTGAQPPTPTTWMRLLPAVPAPLETPPDRVLPRPPARPAPRAAPQAITWPAPAEASSPSAEPVTALPAPATTGAASAAAPALDLRLPPSALRGPAQTRPPAEQRPRSVESTLSRDLADGPLVEEDLGNGRRRFRQGRRCVEVRDSRMAQIDPFNQGVSPVPKQVEDCSR